MSGMLDGVVLSWLVSLSVSLSFGGRCITSFLNSVSPSMIAHDLCRVLSVE